MNITIKKWGNSQGIVLPKTVLSSLGVSVDDELNLELKDDKIILSRVNNFYDFSDLILEDLINAGFKGEDLLNEFRSVKKKICNSGIQLRSNLLNEYKNGEMVDYEDLFDE